MYELTAALDGPPDAPVLVLGNSLGTSRMVWDRQVPAWFRLMRYELPGHGGAAAGPGLDTISGIATGVLALLDSHGIERAAYCGISLGGMIGMWLASHEPDRIDSLGIVCSSAYLPPAEGWRARADQVCRSGMASITEQSIGRWFTPRFTAAEPELVAAFAAELERANPDGYAGCCLAIADMDLRGDLGSITAPTLVISGAQDPSTPPEHGAVIAAGISGARHVVLEGAAHLANVMAPTEVTAALLSHFRVG